MELSSGAIIIKHPHIRLLQKRAIRVL